MRIGEAIDDYLMWLEFQNKSVHTILNYGAILRDFAVYMQNVDVGKVAIDDVIRWFILVKNLKHLKSNSMIPRTAALNGFFEYCVGKGISNLPYQMIKTPKKEPPDRKAREIYPTEKLEIALQRLKKEESNPAIRARDAAMLGLLYESGLRVGEGRALNEQDMDYDKRQGLVNTEKAISTKHIRQFVWSERTNKDLLVWRDIREKLTDSDAVFVSLDRRTYGERLTTRSMQRIVKRATELSGMKGISPRILRRTSAFNTLQEGGEAADIQHKLGHVTLASSTPYTEMWGKELPERLRKFLPKRDAL